MTPQEWAERTAIEQGLPPQVEDPAALARIAALLQVREDRKVAS